jgi:hypothetical protein
MNAPVEDHRYSLQELHVWEVHRSIDYHEELVSRQYDLAKVV